MEAITKAVSAHECLCKAVFWRMATDSIPKDISKIVETDVRFVRDIAECSEFGRQVTLSLFKMRKL